MRKIDGDVLYEKLSENDVRLQATLVNQNPMGLYVGTVRRFVQILDELVGEGNRD